MMTQGNTRIVTKLCTKKGLDYQELVEDRYQSTNASREVG
jgi:hypothetical protein